MGQTNPMVDMRVMELLCSRLCHDLISPIMAVNNGVELLDEDGGKVSGEVRDLLATSAASAASRLQFFRMAYGLGGQDATPVGMAEAARLARGIAYGGKVKIDWPAELEGNGRELPKEAARLLLKLVELGLEALPRGGSLTVDVVNGRPIELRVTAAGTGAGLDADRMSALNGTADTASLTARSVPAYVTACAVRRIGGRIEATPGSNAFTLRATIPS
jgi:histidine phosphotransferase ChpT